MKVDPAFPQSLPSGPDEGNMYYYGISRRDYFAAKAMAAMIVAASTSDDNCLTRLKRWVFGGGVRIMHNTPDTITSSVRAYAHADAGTKT